MMRYVKITGDGDVVRVVSVEGEIGEGLEEIRIEELSDVLVEILNALGVRAYAREEEGGTAVVLGPELGFTNLPYSPPRSA